MARDLRCLQAVAQPRFTLVCLPHAGGNATAFSAWPAHLPGDVALWSAQYPGRHERIREPFARSVADLAGSIAAAVTELPEPIVLLGHSMGAVLAYEVSALLESADRVPRALVISGREAPHLAEPAPPPDDDDDDSLIQRCRAVGGIPDAALDDPELRELVLGPLRADTALLRAHAVPAQPVRTSILAYLGVADPGCTTTQIDGWAALTVGTFRRRLLAGGHFSVLSQPAELLNDLCASLARTGDTVPGLSDPA